MDKRSFDDTPAADSCLMAASGSIVGDLVPQSNKGPHKKVVRLSQYSTLVIGIFAILLASFMENVLELMLYAYAFMVSGLSVPIVAAMFLEQRYPQAAVVSMVLGGGVTIGLIVSGASLPYQLDANVFGLSAATAGYTIVHRLFAAATKQRT